MYAIYILYLIIYLIYHQVIQGNYTGNGEMMLLPWDNFPNRMSEIWDVSKIRNENKNKT